MGNLIVCFLRFASEEKADANYKTLQGKELKGNLLNVDYLGAKSKNKGDLKTEDVLTHFPKASKVSFNTSTVSRTAFVRFFNEEDAAKAFSLKEIEIKGHMLKLNMCPASAFSSGNKSMLLHY
ncbi:hypothetical protein TNIN_462781 [Trichonephila inaurata madagascariensis]|uniref:RRM domain-containing protein n=1 Tax=Trichonephila inaurata madagascariensis TaxID=2747483 RepID=A0A8X6X9N3_9ARAC|nr:hypothetical protein TNIN_462781 [Trichonephila inaurata madagascariensis]